MLGIWFGGRNYMSYIQNIGHKSPQQRAQLTEHKQNPIQVRIATPR